MIIYIILIFILIITVSIVVDRLLYSSTAPVTNVTINNSNYLNIRSIYSSMTICKLTHDGAEWAINHKLYTRKQIIAIYKYMVCYNVFYYFSLPKKYYHHTIKYNIFNGTIYVGCSNIPKKTLKIMYDYIINDTKPY